jgi:hypothetical protein
MAWTAPMTAVANAVFTAAQFNTHVRDNLLETSPAKATTAGSIFVATGTNAIAERTPATALVATSQATTNTSYTDLATVGPAVTVTTGVAALVHINCSLFNATATNGSFMSYAVSGASTVAASDSRSLSIINNGTVTGNSYGISFLQTDLTPGSNTFTAKYRSTAATNATFADRNIIVVPL